MHQEITKEYIDKLKTNPKTLEKLIFENQNDSNAIIFILKYIGKLPKAFEGTCFSYFLTHSNENVRYLAVKNIGKLKSSKYLSCLEQIATDDESSIVRCEAVSAIGRMQNEESIPFLMEMLNNDDPKIICQAIRGLQVFDNEEIKTKLKTLKTHENETIRNFILHEYFGSYKKDDISHSETYSYLRNIVLNADVLDVFPLIKDESIHLTFTSPPYYNARDYSVYSSYSAYLSFLKNVFNEVFRITKEGRFLVVNTSPIIIPRISRKHSSKRYPIPFDLHHELTSIGWEFIDDIVWLKPEYSVRNRVGGFIQHRKPLAYKPNTITEYIMVYRKPSDKLIDWNIRQYDEKTVENSKVKGDFEATNVWKICPTSDKIHSAVFPFELCKKVITYYSFKGDLVFDPFAGSGTVGKACKAFERSFFLTEKDNTYFEYMKTNINDVELFQESNTKFLTLEEFRETIK
ncbi:MAG: DNA methyltransferase [Treponema sp.]